MVENIEFFKPSTTLVRHWVRGIISSMPDNLVLKVFSIIGFAFKIPAIKREFAEQLRTLMVIEFRFMRREGGGSFNFFDDAGRIRPELHNPITDFFAIRDDDIDAFMNLLKRELLDYFLQGGKFSGSWGQVSYKEGRVLVELSEPKKPVVGNSTSKSLRPK